MSVPQTSTCVVTLGGGASSSYVMQEGNWKLIDCSGKIKVASVVAGNAAIIVSKNGTAVFPAAGGVMNLPAGTQIQKNSPAGTPFSPTLVVASDTVATLAQGDTLSLTSDTTGQVEVYITLQRV